MLSWSYSACRSCLSAETVRNFIDSITMISSIIAAMAANTAVAVLITGIKVLASDIGGDPMGDEVGVGCSLVEASVVLFVVEGGLVSDAVELGVVEIASVFVSAPLVVSIVVGGGVSSVVAGTVPEYLISVNVCAQYDVEGNVITPHMAMV